jgi:hypothetical protein
MLAKLSPRSSALLVVLAMVMAAGCVQTETVETIQPNHREVEPVPVPPPPPHDRPVPEMAVLLPFTVIAQGNTSPAGPDEAVYRDPSTWAAVREALRDVAVEPSFPAESVLLAAVEASTGGYRVRFDNVYIHMGQTVANYTVEVPGRSCMTTQALTEPFEAITVRDLPEGSVQFVQQRRAYECE